MSAQSLCQLSIMSASLNWPNACVWPLIVILVLSWCRFVRKTLMSLSINFLEALSNSMYCPPGDTSSVKSRVCSRQGMAVSAQPCCERLQLVSNCLYRFFIQLRSSLSGVILSCCCNNWVMRAMKSASVPKSAMQVSQLLKHPLRSILCR